MNIVKGVSDQGNVPSSAKPILVDDLGRQIVVIGAGTGSVRTPSDSVTRPADTTTYASGDLLANSTTAGSVTPLSFAVLAQAGGGGVAIRRARLRKSNTGTTNAAFRLHLFESAPTVANGDNGAFLPTAGDNYIGSMDFPLMSAFADGAWGVAVPRYGSELLCIPDSGLSIYGLIELSGAYTPASGEVFTVVLELVED